MTLLRKTMTGNGVFSVVTGALSIALAEPLSEMMAVAEAVLYAVGVAVALYGALLLVTARRPVDHLFAFGVIAADLIWVVGAIVLLAIPGVMSVEGKVTLAIISVVVGVFAVSQAVGLIRATIEWPFELRSEVEVEASPAEVWSTLADFSTHGEWNPFIVAGHGDAIVGSELSLDMKQPGGRQMRFRPIVTEASPPALLEWLGHFWRPGIFDGRHRFELTPTVSGTRLVQSESFTGVLVPAMHGTLSRGTLDGFQSMNKALKQRVESPVRHSD